MKVVHAIATLDLGGAEKQLLTLCREQIKNGYRVVVTPLKGSNRLENQFKLIGVEIDNQLRGKKFWQQWIRLIFLTSKRRPFVFHVHSPKAQILFSLLPLKPKNGLVISKHDAMRFVPKISPLLSNLLWKFVQRRSSHIILISNAIRNEMNLRSESINLRKMTVIHYGISREEVFEIQQSNRYQIRRDWDIPEDVFVIGTVGRLVKEKNFLFLIRVFADYVESFPESHLVICGYGPLEEELRKKISSLNIEANVSIHSDVKNIKEVYAGFDLFVLPSITEGFGLVLLEAMSAKIPIVASKVGAIPEVLGQEYKFLFNPSNKGELMELLVKAQDSKLRDECVNQTLEKLPYFSSESMFKQIESIYSSL